MSTIYTLRDNLIKTIAGKEAYLLAIQKERTMVRLRDGEGTALKAVAQFLELNITELKVILNDVNTACSEFSLMGWEINPERMGH